MRSEVFMKRFTAVVNWQTLIVICLSFASCYFTLKYQFTMYTDFLIFGLLIAFPITLTTKEAFKRRERAIQYLSLFKASLQSIYYSVINSKLETIQKESFKHIAVNLTTLLIDYLKSSEPGDPSSVHSASERMASFVISNKKALKGSLPEKISFFLFRVNDSIEFLLATKRHRTPRGLHLIVKIAIFLFVIFYPASLLHETGPDETLMYLFMASVLKSIFLISLLNVQEMLEDPFNQTGSDDIRMEDFSFTSQLLPAP
jgi:hypothetical protein